MASSNKLNIDDIKNELISEIDSAGDLNSLESIRVKYLGRKGGSITNILKSLKGLSIEDRKLIGPKANSLKKEAELLLKKRAGDLRGLTGAKAIDVTAPGKKILHGHLHPLTLIDREVRQIFRGLNFSVVEGPEVESEYYNFDSLNIPPGHPARDMWDTLWLKNNQRNPKLEIRNSKLKSRRLLLRTHTSPMQVRFMEQNNPPFQIIVPGRVFRFEATDATHETNFHQVEGLMVGNDVSLANFKYVVEEFFKQLFKQKIEMRFRPSYFPFTEPSVEVDIKWKGKWLEMMGAGMVNPRVFKAVGYNPKDVQGFAFGVGLERLAMIKYKIPDIRLFHSGDLRFIQQF